MPLKGRFKWGPKVTFHNFYVLFSTHGKLTNSKKHLGHLGISGVKEKTNKIKEAAHKKVKLEREKREGTRL